MGLDLQGGVSVVLQPTNEVTEETLEQAISIIRQRVDALGVAEPEITRQGDNILIQIPGVDDRDRALALVGQTAELQFRPVLGAIPAGLDLESAPTDTPAPGDSSDTTTEAPDTTAPDTTAPDATDETEQGLGLGVGESAGGVVAQSAFESAQAEPPPEPAPDTTAPAAPEGTDTTLAPPIDATELLTGGLPADVCTTGIPSSELPPDENVTLPQCEEGVLVATYQLGPVLLTGAGLESAAASLFGAEWQVSPVFKGGSEGIDAFNGAASQCFSQSPSCPTGQLGIVLDGRVISAPTIQTPTFSRDEVSITGQFTEREARDLATALNYGALPVELEQQQAQLVSATLGRDALEAGLVAGVVGLVLASAYMITVYRFLGLLSVLKLTVEGALLWTVISYLGSNSGLALTLAGITGIIVSIGVSFDSNVVYYEHLKEDVRAGRSIRSATDKSFVAAFSTIVKADVASLIGAGLLWWLTVGPVRGFAFYLGIAGLLDLLASWAFMRPAVKLATKSSFLRARPGLLGLPAEVPPTGARPTDPPVAASTAGAAR
nr:protein translocase subunit SecD [Rhabdothermincola salaria]